MIPQKSFFHFFDHALMLSCPPVVIDADQQYPAPIILKAPHILSPTDLADRSVSAFVPFQLHHERRLFRMVFPFQALYTLSPDLLLSVSRIFLFSRILGMLALAGTGIFSSQSNSSQTGKIISSIIAISFFFALYIPFDTGMLTECLIHKPGYLSMFFVLYALCVGAAFFSFYCSTEAQTSGEFRKAAWGILFLFLGYLGLLLTSSLVIVCIAVVFYVLGTVLLLRGLHQYYLWN